MPTPIARIHIARMDAFDGIGTDWLTDQEATRLQAMTAPERRRSFLAGHWLVRHAAGAWLDLDPRQLAVHHHADGRPGFLPPILPGVSISHSGTWLAVAIATVPIGIDLELSQRPRAFDALARHALSAQEAAQVAAADPAQRGEAFRRFWTLKEARGKRTGDGLRLDQSRGATATPCSAERAEAIAWAFQDGSLAVAVDAGTQIQFVDAAEPGERTYWQFAAEPSASPFAREMTT